MGSGILVVDHINQVQRYPLSNHLYWLSQGKPEGQKIWDFMDSDELNKKYEDSLTAQNMCDTLVFFVKKEQ